MKHNNVFQIKKEWDGCKKCAIGERCYQKAFFDLIDNQPYRTISVVDVVMIGEGPGMGEDAIGIPFIGPAGKLLREAIAQADASELTIGLTNLVLCRPCDRRGGPNRAPNEEEILNCQPRLIETLYAARPRVVVALGQIPKAYIQDTVDILLYAPIVYHLPHPSSILRKGGILAAEWPSYVARMANIFDGARLTQVMGVANACLTG